MIYSSGLSFVEEPELFSHLQNKGMDYLLSISSVLMKSYRFPFAVLLTCDRAEIISEERASIEVFERALSLSPIRVKKYRYSYEGDDAILRLFKLSTGILSPLFGEDTIQGQIAMSMECGRLSGTLSPTLSKLLNMTVAFSKRIHTDIHVRVFDKTVIDEVERRCRGMGDVLIIGSGESARLIALALLKSHKVRLTLRDIEKTFLIPSGAIAVPYEERRDYIPSSDVIISSTSGLYHTLSDSDAHLVKGKLLFDLSLPYDLPSSLKPVRISDLGVPLPEKGEVIRKISALSDKEAESYEEWLKKRDGTEDTAEKAERIATEALRRMSSVIAKAGIDDEKAFREALFDSVRKAVVKDELAPRKS